MHRVVPVRRRHHLSAQIGVTAEATVLMVRHGPNHTSACLQELVKPYTVLRHSDFSVLYEKMSGGGESAVLSPGFRRGLRSMDES